MTEDERQDLLRTVSESHASLSEVALKLRRALPPKAPALKAAIKAKRGAFDLKRTLQQLVVEDLEQAKELVALPEVRLGGKVVDVKLLLGVPTVTEQNRTLGASCSRARSTSHASSSSTSRDRSIEKPR